MKSFKTIILLGVLLLTGCSTGGESSSPVITSSSSEVTTSSGYEEVTDANINSGDYIVGELIYRVDKNSKKLSVIDFDMDFWKHDRDQGELKLEKDIKYVNYSGNDAVYYQDDGKDFFIYKSNNSIYLTKKSGNTTTSQTIYAFPLNPAIPYRPAIYISNQLEQYKVDKDGNRIPDGEGGYQKETFYLFVRLRDTYAALYVGTRTEGWDFEQGYINDYKYSYNVGGMMIKIPHAEDDGYCTLTVTGNYEMRISNHSDKEGNYSGTGTMSFLSEDHGA